MAYRDQMEAKRVYLHKLKGLTSYLPHSHRIAIAGVSLNATDFTGNYLFKELKVNLFKQ